MERYKVTISDQHSINKVVFIFEDDSSYKDLMELITLALNSSTDLVIKIEREVC